MGRPSLADERRPQILGAFEACVLKYGLEESSLDRIATEAGVPRSLIRHYCGNREDLTRALIDGIIDRTVSFYRDIIGRAGAAGGTRVLVDYLMGAEFADSRDDALIDALMAVSHRDARVRDQLRRNYRVFERSLRRELASAFPAADVGDVRAAAYALMCLAVGNASMRDLGVPARGTADARRVAMALMERLGG
jgi:AcrR family transcriptional regulator